MTNLSGLLNCGSRSWPLSLIVAVAIIFAPLSGQAAEGGLPVDAPDATFSIDGKEYAVSEFKERRLMLWFLSTWCSSCIQAVKVLHEKQAELVASGMQIVVLKNHENGGYPGPDIHEFITQYAAPLGNATNWMIGNASAEMGATYNPRRYPDIYFLIDEKGQIVAVEGAPGATLDVIMNFASGASGSS